MSDDDLALILQIAREAFDAADDVATPSILLLETRPALLARIEALPPVSGAGVVAEYRRYRRATKE